MNDVSAAAAITAEDLAFLTDHCRDASIAGGGALGHIPFAAQALGAGCIVLRQREDGRLKAIGVAVDRGIERRILGIVVHHGARGEGVARGLLETLARPHVERDPSHRAVASVWGGLKGGAGLLLSVGFEPAPGQIRFTRNADGSRPQGAAPTARWLDVDREPREKKAALVEAAAADFPGDCDILPTLRSLAASPIGFVVAGFAGNTAKVVAAGHHGGRTTSIVTAYAARGIRDHAWAEHAIARAINRAHDTGAHDVMIETDLPVPRAARTLRRLGFRAIDAAAGFRLGQAPKPPPAEGFLL